jgi:hypothetical protein
MATRPPTGTRQTSPRRPRTAQAGGGEAKAKPAQPGNGQRTATLSLPFVTAQFRLPEVHLPELHLPRPDLPQWMKASVDVVRPYLPSRERALYYGGPVAGSRIRRDRLASCRCHRGRQCACTRKRARRTGTAGRARGVGQVVDAAVTSTGRVRLARR